MPIETILFPSGDGTGDFVVQAVGGPSVKFHTVNSGIVQAFDATYLRSSGVEVNQAGGQVQFLGLEDLPSYTNIIQSISGIVRLRVDYQEDDYSLDLQFFESNGTTALTYPSGKSHSSGGVFQSSEDTFQNHVFNFDFKPGANRGGPCPGNWQDALLKMTVTCDETTSPLDISEIQINVLHTSGDSCIDCPEHLGASGVTTLALGFGGEDPGARVASTELWNGTSWTEINNLSTARTNVQGSGSAIGALATGGNTGSVSALTEEFTASLANKTITAS